MEKRFRVVARPDDTGRSRELGISRKTGSKVFNRRKERGCRAAGRKLIVNLKRDKPHWDHKNPRVSGSAAGRRCQDSRQKYPSMPRASAKGARRVRLAKIVPRNSENEFWTHGTSEGGTNSLRESRALRQLEWDQGRRS